jgi:hypothetical protein
MAWADRLRASIRSPSPRAILLAGWLVFLLYAYPGFMNTESVDQLIDSRTGDFTDWHSPVMTEVWRIVGVVISGPAGMLVLQSLLFLGGAYNLLRRMMSARAAAIASACILVFPPVMATMAVIWPESQLTGFLIAGAACLASPRRRLRLVGLGLVLVACGMRDAAALAALPIIVFGFVWRHGQRRWVRYAIATATWLGLVVAAAGLDAVLVDRETGRNEVALAMLDVVGVVAHAEPLDDAALQRELAGAPLAGPDVQQRARAVHGHPERFAAGEDRVFDPPTPSHHDALVDARFRLARAHPSAYLAHRWYQFARILGLKRAKAWSPVFTRFTASKGQRVGTAHAARHAPIQKAMNWSMHAIERTPLFVPYVYFFIALLVLPLAAIRRQRQALVLLASGIAYELALFVVTAETEYRYSHWLIAATVIAVVMLVARGAAQDRTRCDEPGRDVEQLG